MPNHWHFVLWPERDGQLTDFLRWLTHTHTQRWHAHYHTAGTGHLYQGRFKAFPVQEDHHLLTVLRYVERNPVRAGLVGRAAEWRWSSLARRLVPEGALRGVAIHPCPIGLPADWADPVDLPQTEAELERLRLSAARGRPLGDAAWQRRVTKELGLEFTCRERGRPKKASEPGPLL